MLVGAIGWLVVVVCRRVGAGLFGYAVYGYLIVTSLCCVLVFQVAGDCLCELVCWFNVGVFGCLYLVADLLIVLVQSVFCGLSIMWFDLICCFD